MKRFSSFSSRHSSRAPNADFARSNAATGQCVEISDRSHRPSWNVLMPRQTSTMQYELTDYQWQVAHAIAQTWVKDQQQLEPGKEGIKSELGKAIATCNQARMRKGAAFSPTSERSSSKGNSIGHSGKTIEYYACIEAAAYNTSRMSQPKRCCKFWVGQSG
jgi:hypothetical protein